MKLISLELNNYKKIKYAHIDFLTDEKYYVTGNNMDSVGTADNNGSGKTTFMDGIYWICDGDTLENCRIQDILILGDTVEGSLFLESFGKKGLIERKRTKEGYSEVSLTVFDDSNNGTVIRDTSTKMKEHIFNFLFPYRTMNKASDLSHLLSHIIYLSGYRLDKFSSKETTATERMNIIYSIIDNNAMVQLKAYQEKLLEKRKEIKIKIDLIKKEVLSVEIITSLEREIFLCQEKANLARINNEISNNELEPLEEELKKLKSALVEKERKLKELSGVLGDTDKNLSYYNKEITRRKQANSETVTSIKIFKENIKEYEFKCNSLKLAITSTDSEKFSNLLSELKQKRQQSCTEARIKLVTELDMLRVNAKETITCPNCNVALILHSKGVMLETEKHKIEELQKEIKEKIQMIDKEEATLNNEIKKCENKLQTIIEFQKIENKLKELTDSLTLYEETHPLISMEDLETTQRVYQEKVDKLKKELNELSSTVFTEDMRLLEIKIKTLNNKIRDNTKIIDENIDRAQVINDKLNDNKEINSKYLTGLKVFQIAEDWTNLIKVYKQERLNQIFESLEFEADKIFNEFCGGNLRFEFENLGDTNGKFLIYGKLPEESNFRELNTFSSGEARRCGFAITLATRNIIGSVENIKLLMLDEALDKLDILGRGKILDYLIESDYQLLISSHTEDTENLFSHKITVNRINGEATVDSY
jgi:DNA repair exonuclease SbcCD ATPase subunit